MHSGPSLSEKVYSIPFFVNALLLILPLLGFVFIAFGLLTFLPALNESFEDSVATTIIGVVFCIVMLYMYQVLRQTRLVLMDDGIIYYGWRFRIYTPWTNVIGIGYVQPYPFPLNFRKIRGLQLRQPSVLGMKLADGRQHGIAALETDWWNPASTMAPFAFILPTIPMMGRSWQTSELGIDIQRYAPWICAQEYA